jgi:hypothetical protein
MYAGIQFPIRIQINPTDGEVDLSDARFSIPGLFSDKTIPELVTEFVIPAIENAVDDFIAGFDETKDYSYSITPQSELPTAETININLDGLLGKPSVFQIDSGVTSVALDPNVLASAAGLTLVNINNTVPPVSDEFAVGFQISPNSNFTFSDRNDLTPVAGTIEHTGTVSFDSDLGTVTVGNFSIGFDESRVSENTSGFFVRDTASVGAILFDVSNPEVVEIDGEELTLADADLLVSSEFSTFLNAQGLTNTNLTGADVGDVETNAILKAVNAEAF